MKKIISLFLLFFSLHLQAQVSDLGLPETLKGKTPLPKSGLRLSEINTDSLILANEQNRLLNDDKVYRFGFEHEVQFDFFEQATKTMLPNGNRLSQWIVECPNALSVNVIFNRFTLASGTRLYLVNKELNQYVGAYTSLNNNSANVLGTDLLDGSKIVIEVIEPKEVIGQSTLHVGTIVHGYLPLEEMILKSFGQAGSCNIDVNCPLGQGWENQRNSVACVVSGGAVCSGSMVNNTSGNIIPYYLSANHCGSSPANWVFRFRWERTAANAICATSNSTANNGPTNMTVNGGVLRAKNSGSDFILVELNSIPNPSWGVFYNGWDRSDALTVTQGTGIHHPSGDIKKISRENDPLTQQISSFNGNPNTNFWRINNWDQGVTEPGSSGSPLFDQNKRVIGVLSAGTAACAGLTDNNGYDIYGRFGIAWDQGTTPATRLKEWLDPGNVGSITIDGVDPAVSQTPNDGSISNPMGVFGTICGSTVTPTFNITNNGSNPLTQANIQYSIDGTNVQNYEWTGNLLTYQSEEIVLPSITLSNGNHVFTATITQVNNGADGQANNNQISSNFELVVNGEIVSLVLNLDSYGSEISWDIINSQNTILFQGSGYQDGPNQVINRDFCLSVGCYTFRIYDEYGDGLTSTTGNPGSFQILTSSGEVLVDLPSSQADFGNQLNKPFCVENVQNLDEWILSNETVLYPNPSSDWVNIQTADQVKMKLIKMFDLSGKMILQTNEPSWNVQHLEKGMYLVQIETNLGTTTKSFVMK